MILDSVVLWAHIFGAIGWLGAGMVFAIVIGPSLARMSPQSRIEFFAKVMPKYVNYIRAFVIITILFGVAMVAVLANGDYSIMSPSTSFGLFISAGALLALVTVAVAMSVTLPAATKISKISQTLLEKPGPPPPEMATLGKRLRLSSTAALVMLILVTILMVAGATS